jgi:hypothetical protein
VKVVLNTIKQKTNKEYFPKQSLWSIEPTDDD